MKIKILCACTQRISTLSASLAAIDTGHSALIKFSEPDHSSIPCFVLHIKYLEQKRKGGRLHRHFASGDDGKMKLILLSGGSGKRLWPLSNTTRSKQFLKVLRSSDQQTESMVQRVWRQLETANLAESAFIATSEQQAETIRHHLGCQIPLIIEPERRDTFSGHRPGGSLSFFQRESRSGRNGMRDTGRQLRRAVLFS